MKRSQGIGIASALLALATGCQAGLNGLYNPSRVPPPPMGSVQGASNYTNSNSGQSTAQAPTTPTLGQLRSMESGPTAQARFNADDVESVSINDNSIRAEAKIAPPIASPRVGLSQFSTAVRQASAEIPASQSSLPEIVSAATFDSDSTPANVPATGSLGSDAKWRSTK
jgi:hypothetical protein